MRTLALLTKFGIDYQSALNMDYRIASLYLEEQLNLTKGKGDYESSTSFPVKNID
jgi:hypothetical protein